MTPESRFFFILPVLLGAGLSSGCGGGSTYGTGEAQDRQILSDLTNVFTLEREGEEIDYSARPDLVVPEDRRSLPEPSPGRIGADEARIAAGAPQGESAGSGPEGRRAAPLPAPLSRVEPRRDFVAGRTDRDGIPLYANTPEMQAAHREFRRRLAERRRSEAGRRFLTEPPEAYLTPSPTAPSGEAAYSEEERIAQTNALRKEQAGQIEEAGRH